MPTIQASEKIFSEIRSAIDSDYTTISQQGSSRSGKTYNTLIFLIYYAFENPNTRISVVRNTLPAIKGSVLIDFRDILFNMGVFSRIKENKTELTYHLDNGSWFEFFSADDEQKIRGRKRDVLFANEANELSLIKWQQLKMRTTRFSIIDYNPSFSDEHWICTVNKDPRTYHFISTYKDNPFLEQTIINEIESLQHTSPTLWQVYGLGLQAIIEGLIFKEYTLIDTIPSHIKHQWLGMDFGFTNDPTAIVHVAQQDNNLYLDEICYRTEMLSGDIIRELKEAPPLKVISESADPRLVKEIHRAGINIHAVKKYAGSVDAGIMKMQGYNIHITARSRNIIKEYKNYIYTQDREGKWLNTPIDAFNHAIDATRYVVMNELLGGERKPINTKRLANAI